MSDTPILEFGELDNNQSQREVILNANWRKAEVLIQPNVIGFVDALPGSASDGDRYILADDTDDGLEGDIAYYSAGWHFITPGPGWLAYVESRDQHYMFRTETPLGWVPFTPEGSIIVIEGGTDGGTFENVTRIVFENATVEAGDTDGEVIVTPEGGGGSGDANDGNAAKNTLSIVSNQVTINHANGSFFELELTDDVTTVTHTGVTNGRVQYFTLLIAQDGTGGHGFTPPASWLYPSGVAAYSPTSEPGAVDLIQGVSYDNGTTWLIDYAQDYV